MNQNDQIKYWATMLNEAMEDKANAKNEGFVDTGYFRYVYPETSNGSITVTDLVTGIDNLFPGQTTVNVGPGGKIYGQANGMTKKNGYAVVTIAPYDNGSRHTNMSTVDSPVLTAAKIRALATGMNGGLKLAVEFLEPGLIKRTVIAPVKFIEISKTDGLYLRPDMDNSEIVNKDRSAYNDIMDFIKKRKAGLAETDKIDERRMTGPAAAAKGGKDEIAEFRQMLADGVVEFEFRKADGTLRHAIGTTSEAVVPTAERKAMDPDYDANLASYQKRAAYIIWFWDLEKNACRCFNTNRFEGIVKAEKTAKHVDNSVTQVGNIFIHKDVDAGMEDPDKITPEKADEVNSQIDADFGVSGSGSGSSGFGGVLIGGGFADMSAFKDIEIEIGPSGEPILKIVIRKHGSDSDQPYPLRVNDLRKAVLDKYGVNVKKVVIDGEFQF